MIIELGGGKGGFKEYLEHGQKKGRELHRDQLDQRIVLHGDLSVFEIATASQEGNGRKYDHITLSFSENHVSNELLQVAVNEFRDHAFAAWPEQERHRIAFYAEAHRPKILSYTNSLTGQNIDRLIHIHVGIGKRDLLTGEAVELLGFVGLDENLKFIDSFQESFNAKHGFSSPKDNPKITPENAVDMLARYTGKIPDDLDTFNQIKASLEIMLTKEILAKNITTWEGFEKLLEEHGEVSKLREGKFNEIYRVKLKNPDRNVRLSGVLFQRQFIERPTAKKLAIIQDKAKVAYLEQMQPRKEPAYVASVLKEWHTTKARENRFLHTGSKFYKEHYLPSGAKARLQLLDEIERKYNGLTSPASDQRRRKITPTRGRVPGLPTRDLDGIQKRSEMLLLGNNGVDVPERQFTGRNSLGVRQADDLGGNNIRTNGSSDSTAQGSGSSADRGDLPGAATASEPSGRFGRITAQGIGQRESILQPSSLIDRFAAEQRDRYEQAADKEKYAEIRKNLNCTQLLNNLSHSHGLNVSIYSVIKAKDGSPRIQAGSRALTPSDFLTKELGLAWKEAAPILRSTYEQQINSKSTKPRTAKSAPSMLWRTFKADRELSKADLARQLKLFNGAAKAHRTALAEKLKADMKAALAGLFGPARKAAHSDQKRREATAKAELKTVLNEKRQGLRDSIHPIEAIAWQRFLQTKAQEGDKEALEALRKLDDTAKIATTSIPGITGTLILSAETVLKTLAHHVEKNGDITYRLRGNAVLRDEGRHLAVLDENSESAIVAGLLIAREKFGGTLTLTGSMDFQRRAVGIAVAQGISVKFADPLLEAMRQQLTAEKRQAERASKPVKVADQYYDEALVERLDAKNLEKEQANVAMPEKVHVEVAEVAEEAVQSIQIDAEAPIIALNSEHVDPVEAWKSEHSEMVETNQLVGEGRVLHVFADGQWIQSRNRLGEFALQPSSNIVIKVGQNVMVAKDGDVKLITGQEIGG